MIDKEEIEKLDLYFAEKMNDIRNNGFCVLEDESVGEIISENALVVYLLCTLGFNKTVDEYIKF